MSQLAEIEARLLPMEPFIDKLGGDLSQSIKHVESVPTEACNNNGKIVQELLYDFWRRLDIKGSPHHKNIEELLTQVRRVLVPGETPRRLVVLRDGHLVKLSTTAGPLHLWLANEPSATSWLRAIAKQLN